MILLKLYSNYLAGYYTYSTAYRRVGDVGPRGRIGEIGRRGPKFET